MFASSQLVRAKLFLNRSEMKSLPNLPPNL